MNNLPPVAAKQYEEIKLRGVYLQFAVDAEFIISMVITECFKYNKPEISSFYSDKKGKPKDLDELTMSEKISVCKEGLKRYYPSYYETHEADFMVLDNLRALRNRFAHDKMDFDELEPDTVWLRSLTSNYTVQSLPYKVADLWAELTKFRESIMNILIVLKTFIDSQKQASEPI